MVLGIDRSSVSPSSCHPSQLPGSLVWCTFLSSIGTCRYANSATAEAQALNHFKLASLCPCESVQPKEAPSFEHAHTLSRP